MAQYRATIKGNRGVGSRLGSKKTGLIATIDGWDDGIMVQASWNEKKDCDEFTVWRTGGSNHRKSFSLLAVVRRGSEDTPPSDRDSIGKAIGDSNTLSRDEQ